jgi:succinate dehydrogenase flavin-adding protein (antitoxin of CptAB toxin-antitoxin module)
MTDFMRKKLLYMSTHRGCKEMDIILGKFAESELNSLTDEEITTYKKLLELSDDILYNAISGILCGGRIDPKMKCVENLITRIAIFQGNNRLVS